MQNISKIELKKIDVSEVKQRLASKFEILKTPSSKQQFFSELKSIYAIFSEIETQGSLASYRFYGNTANTEAKELLDYYTTISPDLKEIGLELNQIILNSPFLEAAKSELSQNLYHSILSEDYHLTDRAKELLEKEGNIQNEVMAYKSQSKVSWNDEEVPLSKLLVYTLDTDRIVRKKAFDAQAEYYVQNESFFNEKFLDLVSIRNEFAREIGFANYADFSIKKWNRIGYDYEDIGKFRDALKANFSSAFHKIKDYRRQNLGVQKLTYYDNINFKDGVAQLSVKDPKTTLDKISKIVHEIHPAWGEVYRDMLQNEVIDYLERPNKVDIGFANYLDDIQTPIIFSKLQKTEYDARVMLHEFGHTLQFILSWGNSTNQIHRFCLDTVEIFSHSMEMFSYPFVHELFGDDTSKYIKGNFFTQIGHLNYIPSGDEFQELIYKKENLKSSDFAQVYKICLEKYNLIEEDCSENEHFSNGKGWSSKDHFFHSPFYLIDYSIAIVMAFQLFRIFQDDKSKAIELYEKLAQNIGNLNYQNLKNIAEELKSPFDLENISEISKFVEKKLDEMIA